MIQSNKDQKHKHQTTTKFLVPYEIFIEPYLSPGTEGFPFRGRKVLPFYLKVVTAVLEKRDTCKNRSARKKAALGVQLQTDCLDAALKVLASCLRSHGGERCSQS